MSAAQFTPGPWHYETTPQGKITVYATRNGDDDKIIIGVSQFGPLEQREANARLIAAAPELYESAAETHAWVRRIQDVITGDLKPDGYDADEALNRLIGMLDGPEQREIQGRAFAALAKARGEA